VLVGDEVVAVVDLKTDRERQKLLLQRWTWVSNRSRRLRRGESKKHCTASSASNSRAERRPIESPPYQPQKERT